MEKKKANSIVWQVILFPAATMLLILILAIFLCFFSLKVLRDQEVKSNMNVLQVSLNQMESKITQIDGFFVEYWIRNKSYSYLSRISQRKPIETFLEYQLQTSNWMDTQISMYDIIQGNFIYYENIDLLLFRGEVNESMHTYFKSQIGLEREYNQWELVMVDQQLYIVSIKKYGNFYGGVWGRADQLYEQLTRNEELPGNVYLMDYQNENTAKDEMIHDTLSALGIEGIEQSSEIKVGEQVYYNYAVSSEGQHILWGILVPKQFFWTRIPVTVKWIFALLGVCIVLVPLLVMWLQKRIVVPVQMLDNAMKAVGEGDMEYRIEGESVKHPNELERLIDGFNQMVEQINQLETNLYRTKIREQQIKLKYISQMIQPHFVLNALNIVYTYRESEFPLVKKMIRYLMEYFRYIVYLRTDFVTLSQEMRHVENYLNIQKERYLDAFDYFVEWESEASECMIPPLIIQTFAENCLKYGRRDDNLIFVYVLANIQDGMLRLMIADSGDGFGEEQLKKLHTFVETREYRKDLGIGIQNAIERMDIFYERKVGVNIYNALSGGAVVELFLPLDF